MLSPPLLSYLYCGSFDLPFPFPTLIFIFCSMPFHPSVSIESCVLPSRISLIFIDVMFFPVSLIVLLLFMLFSLTSFPLHSHHRLYLFFRTFLGNSFQFLLWVFCVSFSLHSSLHRFDHSVYLLFFGCIISFILWDCSINLQCLIPLLIPLACVSFDSITIILIDLWDGNSVGSFLGIPVQAKGVTHPPASPNTIRISLNARLVRFQLIGDAYVWCCFLSCPFDPDTMVIGS